MRGTLLTILAILMTSALGAAEDWTWDAERADSYFLAEDYNAAWLFYERALAGGADDGLVVYRAAESFRKQQMIDDPAFGEALYAVARHFLQSQYPDNPAIAAADAQIQNEMVVNRRFLRKTYGVVGGEAPKMNRVIDAGVGTVSGFVSGQLAEVGELLAIIRSEGVREGFSWAKQRAWSLLLTWLLLNLLTGIILPTVMAITVAREGRKSYVTAYLFLLHWGPLGIHRFYLGRYVGGIVWLLSGGLLGLGVFFDIFLTGAYVRFWNEDHRGERPFHSSGSTGKVNNPAPKTRRVKPQKVKKTKTPKPPKAVKTPKPKNEKKPKESKKETFDDEFAMGAAASGDNLDFSTTDDDFGDLPDLDLEDGPDDFSTPSADPGDDFNADFPNELNDDDFDLGSLD
ncbi:MAG: TM2 domain-containing protein [Spirochaetaceae bacterium]|nr:TM2 domain-containing protein [Spirochaetaceae bacterium]